jgi:phosphotransferase system  glucose/maltose/N-acetylglucosamine-specific IIC component
MKVMLFMIFLVSFIITLITCVLASEFNSILLFIIGVIFALITTIILEYTLADNYYKFDKKYLNKKFTCYYNERKDRK